MPSRSPIVSQSALPPARTFGSASAARSLFAAVALLGGIFASGNVVSAQSVTTVPVGAVSISINAAPSGGTRVSTFSPSLRLSVGSEFQGKSKGSITGVTSTVISDTSAAWSAGGLSQVATPYFVKITSGAASGAMWQISTSAANTDNSFTVLAINSINPQSVGVVSGDTYQIIPADTLNTLFSGVESEIGGTSALTADGIRLHDGLVWRDFYYNTSVNQWREGTATFNRNNIVVRPNSGVIFTRRKTTAIALTIVGEVVPSTEKFPVPVAGVSFIGGVHPVDRTVSSLSLNQMPGFVVNTGGGDAALVASDKLRFFDGNLWRVLNFNSSASQWREGTSTFNRNNLIIPAGSPVIIERGSGASGSSTLASIPAPYSL